MALARRRASSTPRIETKVALPAAASARPAFRSPPRSPRHRADRRRSGRRGPDHGRSRAARCAARSGALARIAPASQENAISAPVFMRCSRVIAPMSKRLMLGDQIDHLAADHAGGTGRRGQRRDELAAHRRIAMRVGIAPAPRTPASAARRRPAPPSPRRTACGRSAGRGADRCCPSPADRRGPASRHAPSRSPPRPATRSAAPPRTARAPASTRNGRSRLPGASAE